MSPSWLGAGFAGAIVLIFVGGWRIADEEIPRLALATAAFFVASFIHVKVGPSSVHLLLNGLVGVVLGRRAGLAIFVALFMQAVLAGHGGYYTLGVNTCVMALPALAAWLMFAGLLRLPLIARPWFRTGLVVFCCALWMLSLVSGVALVALNPGGQVSHLPIAAAGRLTFHPITLGIVLVLSLAGGWLEKRLENSPEFPLGLLVGEAAVLFTAFLNAVVLIEGGAEDWPSLALVSLVPHVFLAAVEGLIVGFTIGFLARVKPELLAGSLPEKTPWLADTVS